MSLRHLVLIGDGPLRDTFGPWKRGSTLPATSATVRACARLALAELLPGIADETFGVAIVEAQLRACRSSAGAPRRHGRPGTPRLAGFGPSRCRDDGALPPVLRRQADRTAIGAIAHQRPPVYLGPQMSDFTGLYPKASSRLGARRSRPPESSRSRRRLRIADKGAQLAPDA